METHTPPTTSPSVRETLDQLTHDRAVLAERVSAPQWLWPTLGLVNALFVASPATGNETTRNGVFVFCVIAATIIAGRYARDVGARGIRSGIHGVLLGTAYLVGTLILLSVSLGLAASEHSLWVILPAGAGFLLVLGVGWLFTGVIRERLTDVP